ncbi:helix-turn-helix transcriptional regulator [Paenibacillus dakarensis]|uniref:helix-turn-helix transcriptional regulator n=1 Tax=Paenibacillus dakarensis TaxID=1527293 RepID=UPI0006D5304D|nr:YafY family protein [Paenibacillus dakarensis]
MKIDRLLAITVLLLNRGRVSAKELSERFEVTSKTIYRDMDTLSQAGIPIVSHQGISGGFEIMEQFMIDRYLLSIEEMEALVTAVKGINRALDDQETDALLQKVNNLLQKAQRGSIYNKREERFIMDMNPWGQRSGIKETMKLLRVAISERKRVAVEYISSDGTCKWRMTEPASLILKGTIWYVLAYCTMRRDFRIFRLSRIQHAELMEEVFEPRELPVIEQLQWDENWTDPPQEKLVFKFELEARQRIADIFHPDEITMMPDGSIQVQTVMKPDEWLYGIILSFGSQVKVESPDFVAREVVRRAEQIIGCYMN